MGYIELYKGMEKEIEALLGFTPNNGESHEQKHGNGNWD